MQNCRVGPDPGDEHACVSVAGSVSHGTQVKLTEAPPGTSLIEVLSVHN